MLYGKGGIQGRDLEYATDGNYNNDTFADCTGDACVWDIGEIRDVGSIMFVLLSEGRVYRDITIAVSEDGAYWVPVMNGLEIHTWVDSIGHPNMVEVSETYYPFGAGSASGAHQVRQGDTSGCGLCSAGTLARGGASTCASCTTGSYNTGTGN